MGFFDNIAGNVGAIAGKVGLPPEQVQALAATLKSKVGGGTDQLAAIEGRQ